MKAIIFTTRNKAYKEFIDLAETIFDDILFIYPDNHPKRVDTQYPLFLKKCNDYSPDIILSFYYSRIIQSEILSIPKLIAVNFHGSLLPNYAGSHALNWQIINGGKISGVTLHTLSPKIDGGKIIIQKKFKISIHDDANDVLKNGISTSMDILLKFSRQLESKSLTFRDQNITGDEFKCRKRYPSDGEILPTMTEDQVYNLIRALVSPWPGAFYCDKECKKIIIDNKISIKDASSILEKIRSK